MKFIIRFLNDENGQTSTEYILLLVVVAMIVFKFKNEAMGRLESLVKSVFGKAEGMVEQLDDLQ